MPDRVILVEAELNLTIAMLELPTVPSFDEARQRPLAFLTQVREDLRGCVSVPTKTCQPRASPLSLQAAVPQGIASPYTAIFLCRWPWRPLHISPRGD